MSGRDGALETWWHPYGDGDWQEADRLLAEAGLAGDGFGDRPFAVISEGERQQVLLARALMGRPELLLLDEPAAGLDLGARERLVSRLGRLAADPATPPVVLVTHHAEEIPTGFTHMALMRRGRLFARRPDGGGHDLGRRHRLLRRRGHRRVRRGAVVEPGVRLTATARPRWDVSGG